MLEANGGYLRTLKARRYHVITLGPMYTTDRNWTLCVQGVYGERKNSYTLSQYQVKACVLLMARGLFGLNYPALEEGNPMYKSPI